MNGRIGSKNIAAARAQRDILQSRGKPVPEEVERLADLKMDILGLVSSNVIRHGRITEPLSDGVEDLLIRGQAPLIGAVHRGHIRGITASFGIRDDVMESITITPDMVRLETTNGYTHIFEVVSDDCQEQGEGNQ